MQCGGLWGTRLDAHVSLGARLGGAVLVVSPRGMRRRGFVRTSPSSRFRVKKWPYGPPRETTPWLLAVVRQLPTTLPVMLPAMLLHIRLPSV